MSQHFFMAKFLQGIVDSWELKIRYQEPINDLIESTFLSRIYVLFNSLKLHRNRSMEFNVLRSFSFDCHSACFLRVASENEEVSPSSLIGASHLGLKRPVSDWKDFCGLSIGCMFIISSYLHGILGTHHLLKETI